MEMVNICDDLVGQAAKLFSVGKHANDVCKLVCDAAFLHYQGLLFILIPAKETLLDSLLSCVQIALSAFR